MAILDQHLGTNLVFIVESEYYVRPGSDVFLMRAKLSAGRLE